jgi:L-alanine-DL-glutamate epimerase-like enolase superfamily enzyme
MERRSFLRNTASAALLTGVAGCRQVTPKKDEPSPEKPAGTGPYLQMGRTEGYEDFAVIEKGRQITRIETFSKQNISLVRLTTGDGQSGWGQISTYNADIAATILHRNLAGQVLGSDPAEIDELVDRCIEANLKYPWSYVNRALGGIDTAIWDLYGQIEGKPVCELLGGVVEPVRIYGSSMSRSIKPDDELERMLRLKDEKGFTAFKFRIGKEASHNGDAWENRTEEMITTLGPALADTCSLLADANSGYTPDRAIHYGKMLEEHGIGQFEEPCPYWETEWIMEVTDALSLDVSGGEQDNDIAKWRRMINGRTFDIIQPDPLYLGGITRTWRTALMANQAGIPCIPHSANHGMVTLFTLHLMRAIPNPGKYMEFSIEFDEAINREVRTIFSPVLEIEEGKLHLPSEPGWGITVHPDWLNQADYRVSEVG